MVYPTSDGLLRVIKIFGGTTVDGCGLRTSIYFAGCKHCCYGCHNPESWDMNGGMLMTLGRILEEVNYYRFNVTLTGGDPLYQDLSVLSSLCRQIHEMHLNIWLYTGFIFETLLQDSKYDEILDNVDVVVDGPFIIDMKSNEVSFRGLSIQRIIT